MQQEPHLRNRSDFIGNQPLAKRTDEGILVARSGNEYRVAVELNIDSVVEVATAQNEQQAQEIIERLKPEVPDLKQQFETYFP